MDIHSLRGPTLGGLLPSEEAIKKATGRLAQKAYMHLGSVAGGTLGARTFPKFWMGVAPPILDNEGLAELRVWGVFAKMIERGWPGGDMRTFLLNPGKPSVKRSSQGFLYTRIPIGGGFGAPVDKAYPLRGSVAPMSYAGPSGTKPRIRTLSEKPSNNPLSWIHPGIRPFHFMDDVRRFISDMAPKMMQELMDSRSRAA